MQLKYKYFYGGDWNPFGKEADEAYRRLSEERKLADPQNEMPVEKVFPKLDSWPQYVISESKSTFWKMERSIANDAEAKSQEVETIWKEALGQKKVEKWIIDVEGDETEKAMCYYIKVLHGMFSPNDRTVDFRLYFSEGGKAKRLDEGDGFSQYHYDW